jgi:UDP-N-acetylglucosamine diphosphorylase / glucose-1-phosphate thymidylyltransferase / UDP-N-acetylgalactosamine diphosphorylase / glucosamine-1-phosphate N-acetyltransferase / galactosamine-1-phosphate N-acetyltransferase
MKLVIFDDVHYKNFFPVTYTRSIGDLRVGILKLRQRINFFLENDDNIYIIADYLEDLYKERHPDWIINQMPEGDVLLVNSRIKITEEIAKRILNLPIDHYLVNNKALVAARLEVDEQDLAASQVDSLLIGMREEELEGDLMWNWIWQLITENGDYIRRDFQAAFYDKDNKFDIETGVTIIDPYNVWLGEGVVIKPGVVIDGSSGPVVIDEEALIMPNAVINGPAYIGKKSVIKACATIYENTSIGPVCKIGGEVEGCIFQAYVNKQHNGFMGHSYLGEWVNIGAGTNNSDLKNNYKPIRVHSIMHEAKMETGLQFLGCQIGDHCKIGINTTINSGTVIGFGCNIYGETMVKDYIRNLHWGEAGNLHGYQKEKFLETVEMVKLRRGLILSDVEKELYMKLEHLNSGNSK